MNSNKVSPHFTLLLVFIIAAGLLRIINVVEVTPFSNLTPIGAMALFGGAYFKQRWKAFAFPLLTLFVGDVFIHTLIFDGRYEGRPVIYLAFALMVFIGMVLIKKVTLRRVTLSCLTATLTFWMIADFSVWFTGGRDIRTGLPLSRGWDGLLQSYVQGIPFVTNFLLGTLLYCAVMFGLFEWMQKRFAAFRLPGKMLQES